MKLTKMEFDEEKMSEECGELANKNSLNECKPQGVGVFSYSDGPPAAGGGIGMFFWFHEWQELYQFLANYFIAMAPGPISEDHHSVYEKTWDLFKKLSEGKIRREHAIQQINQVARNYSQIEWWGTFEELCEGQGEFEKKVRQHCLRSADGKIGSAEKKKLMEAIAEYGV